jgi:hypothetical protein
MDDLFNNGPMQLGLDLPVQQADENWPPNPQEIREELQAILAIAKRAQDCCPWDAKTFKFHKTVFPQMATWLPDDERDQLRFEFAQEVERIELLMAA